VTALDGSAQVEVGAGARIGGDGGSVIPAAERLGAELAGAALGRGAGALLAGGGAGTGTSGGTEGKVA
jgi:hypothetical protein